MKKAEIFKGRLVKRGKHEVSLTKNKVYDFYNEMTCSGNYVEVQIMDDFGKLIWLARAKFQTE